MPDRQAKRNPISTLALLGILTIAALSPGFALAQDLNCHAETLLPGSVLRRHHQPLADRELVRVSVSEPGVLELYLSAGARSEAPRMTFLGRTCTSPSSEDASWARIRETPRELYLLIRAPGDFFVEISAVPGTTLPAYAFHATAAPDPLIPDEVIALAENPATDCRASDLPAFSSQPFSGSRYVTVRRDAFTKEVDPWDDDGMSGHVEDPGVLVVSSPDATLDAALHDGEDCTLERRVAEGTLDAPAAFVAAPVHAGAKRLLVSPRSGIHYDVHLRHFALCDAAEDDRPLCAAHLRPDREVKGLVSSSDEDHLTFVLDALQTVGVDLAGDDGVRAVLFDARGQRLAIWSTGRLVRTLGAGRFYLLVTDDGRDAGGWTAGGWMAESATTEYSVRLEMMP